MQHFPVFLDLQARPVLVLGSGEVAERKAEPLRAAGAEIRFASRFDEALRRYGWALARFHHMGSRRLGWAGPAHPRNQTRLEVVA